MKSFRQFMEQNKLNTTNTKEALKNVFSGKDIGELQQKLKSGEINIGDMEKVVKSDEVRTGIEGVVQGVGKDANINVTKFLNNLQNFKIPKK